MRMYFCILIYFNHKPSYNFAKSGRGEGRGEGVIIDVRRRRRRRGPVVDLGLLEDVE